MLRSDILAAVETLFDRLEPALPNDESGEGVRQQFSDTLIALRSEADFGFQAETVLNGLITYYPNLTAAIPRSLLWAVGGTCLHFLGDEEIDAFAQQEGQLH